MFKPLPLVKNIVDISRANNFRCEQENIKHSLESNAPAHPWYVQCALGASAWIAAGIFTMYITRLLRFPSYTSDVPEYPVYTVLLLGMGLYIAGIIIYRLRPQSITLRQLSLALSLGGMLCCLAGIESILKVIEPSYSKIENETITGALVLAAEVIIFWLHSDPVRRYLAVTNGLPLILIVLSSFSSPLSYQLLVGAGITAVYLLWTRREWQLSISPTVLKPLKYGLPVALFIIVHGLVLKGKTIHVEEWVYSNLMAAGILSHLCFKQLKKHNVLSPVFSALALTLILSTAYLTLNSPGILVAITLIFIGFQCSNRLLLFASISAFIFFLGHFYFALELDLIRKSILMTAGGILFLFAAWIMHRCLAQLEIKP